jgi:hypothetical protein
MIQPEFFVQDSPPECTFMEVIKHSSTNFTVNMDIAYAPNTTGINAIMKIVQGRYTKKNIIDELKKLDPTGELSLLIKEFKTNSKVYGKTIKNGL